ncbi:hypothetical protein EV714DRAFT_271647 [Schizophyllum commune]
MHIHRLTTQLGVVEQPSVPAYGLKTITPAPLLLACRHPPSVRSTRSNSATSPLAKPPTTPSQAADDSEPNDFAYDPTYGLRPEGVPQKSNFHSFSSLFSTPTRGLADLAEETEDSSSTAADLDSQYDDVDDLVSEPFDVVDWGDPRADLPTAVPMEYETVPAIGGGTVTRPHVLHAQSRAMTPDARPSSRAGPMSAACTSLVA